MKICTLCFLLQGENVLLGMKKRGFGEGKWDGFGGKVMQDETVEEAAIRELEEESGIKVRIDDLKPVAEVDFIFENDPDLNNHTVVYISRNWQGEPIETEEMKPRWFERKELPFSAMWSCDAQWIPSVLAEKMIKATVYFDNKHDFRKVDIENLG
jgi:8-oxo-dGTP pyrophosphatase MutT (NUDIX family)